MKKFVIRLFKKELYVCEFGRLTSNIKKALIFNSKYQAKRYLKEFTKLNIEDFIIMEVENAT